MMLEAYQKWLKDPNNNSSLGSEDSADNFSIFYQHHCVGKGWFEMLADLAYQVYELQVCIDGILEDLEK